MSITAISSSTSTDSTTSTSSSTSSLSSLTTEDFLKLLLAELENQDPTDPMSTSEMVTMFSSLTQVSAAQTTNEYLASLVDSMSSASNSDAVSYLGKTITYTNSDSEDVSSSVSSVTYTDGIAYLETAAGDKVELSSVTGVSS